MLQRPLTGQALGIPSARPSLSLLLSAALDTAPCQGCASNLQTPLSQCKGIASALVMATKLSCRLDPLSGPDPVNRTKSNSGPFRTNSTRAQGPWWPPSRRYSQLLLRVCSLPMAGGAGWLGVAGKAGPHPSNSRPAAFVSSRRLVVTVCHTHAQAANAVLSCASAMVAENGCWTRRCSAGGHVHALLLDLFSNRWSGRLSRHGVGERTEWHDDCQCSGHIFR